MFDIKEPWSLPLVFHLVVILVVGIGLNIIPAPFNSSGIAVFGCGAAVYAALRFPPAIAIPMALAISAPLWMMGGSIVGKESLTLLPVVVSLFGYKKPLRQVIKVGTGFWSLVFLPILLLEHALYEADQLGMLFSGVLVTWVSGVFGLISGHFTYLATNGIRRQQADSSEKVSLHFLFSYFFSGCFFVASMAVIYLSVSLYQAEQERHVKRYMEQRVSVLQQQLTDFITSHHKAISVAAQSLSTPGARTRLNESATHQLQVLSAHYPEFLTFLVANDAGRITHAYPPTLLDRATAVGAANVAYRPYFSKVMETGAPYLSNVFQGRGFGSDPIVAMSAPIVDEEGTPKGIVEGSLSLKSFAAIDALNLPGFLVLLEDQNGDVIYASSELGLKPLSKAPSYSCGYNCNLKTNGGPLGKHWLRVSGDLPSSDWRVGYYYDYRRLLGAMGDYLFKELILLLVLSILGTFTGSLVARMIDSPIRRLIRYIANFSPTGEKVGEQSDAPILHIKELASLNDEFTSLERRLLLAFEALEQARVKEQTLNVELARFNQSLEARIKEKTQHLANALDEAKAASVAKTQFLANMSHEIRTPMNGIVGSCELMLESELSETAYHRAQTISRSASNLLMILDSILDWSKIESGKMHVDNQHVSIHQLLEASSELYEHPASKKGVKIKVDIDSSVPQAVITDGGKVSQVINNLVSNAVKFTHHGAVYIKARYEDGKLFLSVTDTGIGIAPNKLDAIFEQFEQADTSTTRDYGGTGLGLAISKGLVELLGGDIHVESHEGEGTEFSFNFPCEVGTIPDEILANKPCVLPTDIKVLLAEDNDINAEIVMNMLSSAGIKCIRAKNGKDAVEAASHFAFDVILMDCQMPVLDGISASKIIRQQGKNKDKVAIVALTANAFAEDKADCLRAGMNAHLSKPIKKQVLFDCIARELARI